MAYFDDPDAGGGKPLQEGIHRLTISTMSKEGEPSVDDKPAGPRINIRLWGGGGACWDGLSLASAAEWKIPVVASAAGVLDDVNGLIEPHRASVDAGTWPKDLAFQIAALLHDKQAHVLLTPDETSAEEGRMKVVWLTPKRLAKMRAKDDCPPDHTAGAGDVPF